MSVFQRLKVLVTEQATKINAEYLEHGKKYYIYEFKTRRSDYCTKDGKYPDNLVAYFKINNLKYYMTLPAVYNNQPPETVEEMNQTIKDGKAPFLVYYGKDGQRNHIIVHDSTEEVDQELLKEFNEKMNKQQGKQDSQISKII